jgi:hypothetical protein
MARPEVTGRKIKRQKTATQRERSPATGVGKTITQFCRDWDIGKATFYLWKKQGLAPAVTQPAGPGGRALITPASEAAWAARHTTLAAAIDAAE